MTFTWTWRKSSRSASGECVEVGTSAGTPLTAVRDSKLGSESPVLTFTHNGIGAFLRAAKAGQFDGLA